ncbi:TIGR02266 family protein [Aggregicoccus sp. 17bor-14]|uniref:TIGR02266 family protein n=1 Tax=Myxococcaceae TaxID=31 RepID=UPI00129D2157|nr:MULTISPECIES: TIGR02266 family protein [Myxococcaceae]MBF5040893.1 TIGR02266 family protein [Simulacricoccus sp. 17bor-14]MRI86682.1 TIGR02266 family protein [Aggregicoccus sp. 17bor-14]
MTDKVESSPPQRRGSRLQHELLVAYRSPGGASFASHWAVNLSGSGLFINTSTPLPVGSPLELVLSLPDAPTPFEVEGRVARVSGADNAQHQGAGMGIEFVNVDEDRRSRIERFVTRLRQELPELSGGSAQSEAKR